MSRTSGMLRELQSARSGIKFSNLTEFRGTLVDALTDYFFGMTSVDYDWRDVTELDKVTKWVYTQDGDYTSTTGLYIDKNQVYIDNESTTFAGVGLSNQRELFTFPETATWGIAHALTEIVCGDTYNQVTAIAPANKPQHGLGLRAQEDTGRRAVMFWHDSTFGLPQSLNLGVWRGNLDGSGFINRGMAIALDLDEVYTMTGARRQSNEYIVDVASHGYVVGDMVNVTPGVETAVAVTRASNVVTGTTTELHGCVPGDIVRILFGTASFAGTFTVLTAPTTTTLTWAQSGINESGSCTLWDYTDRRWGKRLTAVTATELRFPDTGPDKTFIMDGAHQIQREFPYWMEMRVAGEVAMGRCWGRHQPVPSWMDPLHSMIGVLDAPAQNYTVTQRERTSNLATLEIGTHNMIVGERITITAITPTTYNGTNKVIQAVTPTAVTYDSVSTDEAPTASTGTVARIGMGTAATVISNPMPEGSGRIAFVGAHIGDTDDSRCVYGGFYGDSSFGSIITAMAQTPAIEIETALPITRTVAPKIVTVNVAVETETATTATRTKIVASAQAIEAETASLVTPAHSRTVGQAIETETATTTARTKIRAAAQVVETELANAAAAQRVRAVATATEAESATAVARTHARTVSQAIETETATATAKTKVLAAQQAVEVESATVTGRIKVRAAAQVTEVETAGTVTRLAANVAGQAVETEVALGIVPLKVRAVAQVTETETATATGVAHSRIAGQAQEAETATPVARTKVRTAAQVIELESALIVLSPGKLRTVTEVEIAQPIAAQKIKAVATATEVETATTTARAKVKVAAQVIETETAGFITLRGTIRQVSELELAQHITVIRIKSVAQATETESALIIRPGHLRTAGQAIELEQPLAFSRAKVAAVLAVTEFEPALAIVRFVVQVGPPSSVHTGRPVSQGQTHSRHGARGRVSTGKVRII